MAQQPRKTKENDKDRLVSSLFQILVSKPKVEYNLSCDGPRPSSFYIKHKTTKAARQITTNLSNKVKTTTSIE